MNMSKFLVDAYFVEHEPVARYMMGSSDPESLKLCDVIKDFGKYREESLGYPLDGYHPLLKKLAGLYRTVAPEQIAVMNGGEETIYVTMRALLERGDEVVVHTPCFQSLSVIAEEIGCRMKYYRPSFENGWKFDFPLLESMVSDKTRMVVLNYPHNPTGACLTLADMKNIVRLCRAHDAYLVSDEMYRFLCLDPAYSTESFADLYENAVALGGFSKTFASPGLRLGWIAAKNPVLMQRLLAYRHFTSTCVNLLSQLAAAELLDKAESVIQRNNALIRRNYRLFQEFIEEHCQLFACVPPKGATMAYVRLRNGQTSMDFCMEILEHTGVLIVPSSVLEASDEYIRVGMGRENFPECLRLVDDYLRQKNDLPKKI